MIKKTIYIILLAAFICLLSAAATAEMHSSSYQITTAVLSGGGEYMDSDSYNMTITLAQPSPIIESENPPQSEDYVLYAGFWYTLDAQPRKKGKAMPWLILLLDDEE